MKHLKTFSVAIMCAGLYACSGAGLVRDGRTVPAALSGAHLSKLQGWFLSAAKGGSLLYASDVRNSVVVIYSYPGGKQVGELTGFPAKPAGLCSDAAGHIYVTTQGNGESLFQSYVYEYAHGGTSPIGTFTDPGLANGCAVDPSGQNFAVTNNYGPSGSYGDVAVYPNGQSNPVVYSDPNVANFEFCSYDSSGNLFADGIALLDELPQGSDSLVHIQLSKSINLGSVQFVGGRLAIAEPVGTHGPQPIYLVTIASGYGQVTGPIELSTPNGRTASGDIQFWINNKKIIGPGHVEGGNGLLRFWKFPKGGLPINTVKPNRKRIFFGVTVSVAPS